jgi:transcription-repair coupling factor (superfamily II helicase)
MFPNASLTLDEGLEAKREARWDGIVDQYETRKIALGARGRMDSVYKPVPAEQLYLDEPAWAKATAPLRALKLVTLPQPTGAGVIDAGGRIGRNFAPERQLENVNLFSV